MKRLFGASVLCALLASAMPAFGQTAEPPQTETRPATTTVTGDTGFWFVPTAEILGNRKWSISLFRKNADFGQGFTDATNFPATVAVGLGNRVELFGSFEVITRIDRDTRPIFFTSSTSTRGASGGIVNEYPLVTQGWIGNRPGDLRIGAKINLLSEADQKSAAFAVRGGVKIATGDDALGASTGKTDFWADAIVSKNLRVVEVSGFGGVIVRGNPDGFKLSNGIRWGAGMAFPTGSPIRLTAELHGEKYLESEITAPANFRGIDGSIAPTTTQIGSPIYAALGLTYQAENGFFLGGGLNWSGTLDKRADAFFCASGTCPVFGSGFGDRAGIQVRIGYHPGARKFVAPPPPPPPRHHPPPPPHRRRTVRPPCARRVTRAPWKSAACRP